MAEAREASRDAARLRELIMGFRASQMIYVNAGDALSAVIKLPLRIPPFAGLMGSASTPAAAAVQAAATSVLAVTTPGTRVGPTCALQ